MVGRSRDAFRSRRNKAAGQELEGYADGHADRDRDRETDREREEGKRDFGANEP